MRARLLRRLRDVWAGEPMSGSTEPKRGVFAPRLQWIDEEEFYHAHPLDDPCAESTPPVADFFESPVGRLNISLCELPMPDPETAKRLVEDLYERARKALAK